jgi:SAM-dependent methyltransferase
MTDLDRLRRTWNHLGAKDPAWAILSCGRKRGRCADLGQFFETGRAEVLGVVRRLAELGLPHGGECALDFGCGIGRLTQALASYYTEVDGVDIAESMIEAARRWNESPGVRFRLSTTTELADLPTGAYDLVCSLLVLQHLRWTLVKRYLAELLRVLRPGGILCFNMPSHHAATPLGFVNALLPQVVVNIYRQALFGTAGVVEIHGVRRDLVIDELVRNGGIVESVDPDPVLWPVWTSYRYYVRRQPG